MAECVYSLLKLISATSDFFQYFYWTAFNIMTCCSFLPESLCLFQHSFSLVVFLFDSSAFIVTQCNLYSFIVAHFVLWIAIYHCPSSAFLYMIRSKWSENGFQKLLKRLSNLKLKYYCPSFSSYKKWNWISLICWLFFIQSFTEK